MYENKQSYLQLIPASFVVIARRALSSQNNKFAISLKYLKKKGKDGVDFLHLYKYQSFLQVDTIHFGWHIPKVPNITSLQRSEDEVDFLCR